MWYNKNIDWKYVGKVFRFSQYFFWNDTICKFSYILSKWSISKYEGWALWIKNIYNLKTSLYEKDLIDFYIGQDFIKLRRFF